MNHWKVARYYTTDEHSRVPEIQLASERLWQQLPEEYRQIIAQCALESALYQRELWQLQEERARTEVMRSGCLEIQLSGEAKEEFRLLLQPLYEQYCADYMDLVDQIRNG